VRAAPAEADAESLGLDYALAIERFRIAWATRSAKGGPMRYAVTSIAVVLALLACGGLTEASAASRLGYRHHTERTGSTVSENMACSGRLA